MDAAAQKGKRGGNEDERRGERNKRLGCTGTKQGKIRQEAPKKGKCVRKHQRKESVRMGNKRI